MSMDDVQEPVSAVLEGEALDLTPEEARIAQDSLGMPGEPCQALDIRVTKLPRQLDSAVTISEMRRFSYAP